MEDSVAMTVEVVMKDGKLVVGSFFMDEAAFLTYDTFKEIVKFAEDKAISCYKIQRTKGKKPPEFRTTIDNINIKVIISE